MEGQQLKHCAICGPKAGFAGSTVGLDLRSYRPLYPGFQGSKKIMISKAPQRFGDTAGNVAILILLADSGLAISFQTAAASLVSAGWRMFIMPIDTVKTTLQVKRTKKCCQYKFSSAGGGSGCSVPAAQKNCSRRARHPLARSLGGYHCYCCWPLPMVSHLQHAPVSPRAGNGTSAKCLDRPCCQPCVRHSVKLIASAQNPEANQP